MGLGEMSRGKGGWTPKGSRSPRVRAKVRVRVRVRVRVKVRVRVRVRRTFDPGVDFGCLLGKLRAVCLLFSLHTRQRCLPRFSVSARGEEVRSRIAPPTSSHMDVRGVDAAGARTSIWWTWWARRPPTVWT